MSLQCKCDKIDILTHCLTSLGDVVLFFNPFVADALEVLKSSFKSDEDWEFPDGVQKADYGGHHH